MFDFLKKREKENEIHGAQNEIVTDKSSDAIYGNEPIKSIIGKAQIKNASEILEKYRKDKEKLESRIIKEEQLYMRLCNAMANTDVKDSPNSGWLFNSVTTKHADIMDSYPSPICLPREESDEIEAQMLSDIIPVILESNNFQQTYSDEAWYKLKHGVGVYSVLWNPEADNGLGNIDVGRPDLLNLYWQGGVCDIQDSPNFFSVSLWDNKVLTSNYPQLDGKLGESLFTLKKYTHDETDTTDKSLVIDWYYKKKIGSKTIVHYCKYVGEELLYSSENDPQYALNGYYEHGLYPFIFDVLYPIESSAVGFGIIAIGSDAQQYIDLLDKYILDNARDVSKERYFFSDTGGVNEEEFKDKNKEIIHVAGSLDERLIRKVEVDQIPTHIINARDYKVNEIKETTSNRDFSNGSTSSGVTSGAAIATLQEAGNKTSRDILKGTYSAFEKIALMIIELIRQFYTEERSFRIDNPDGAHKFVSYSNEGLLPQVITQNVNGNNVNVVDEHGMALERIPIIDIKVKAQKQSPFTTMAQNETAINLYNIGFFEPERATQSLIALELMDFEGKDKVKKNIEQGRTLLQMISELQTENNNLKLMLTGSVPPPSTPTDEAVINSAAKSNNPSMHNAMESKNYMSKLIDKANHL